MQDRRAHNEDEVLAEVVRILSDAAGTATHEGPMRGLFPAVTEADQRFVKRLTATHVEGPELLAGHLAHWTVDRADRAERSESLEVALDAAHGRGRDPQLGADLREFIHLYVSGEMSDEEFVRRLKKPRRAQRRRRKKRAVPPGAIELKNAARHLRDLLDAEGALEGSTIRSFWPAFREFAEAPVIAPPGDVESDVLFVELSKPGTTGPLDVVFTRQFALVDEDGDQDHMEYVSCTFTLELDERLEAVASGVLSEGPDRTAWLNLIETHEAFIATADRPAIAVAIQQSEI